MQYARKLYLTKSVQAGRRERPGCRGRQAGVFWREASPELPVLEHPTHHWL